MAILDGWATARHPIASDDPVIFDADCSVCGERVAYKELYPAGVRRPAARGAEHPSRRLDRPWMYASNGDREGDIELQSTEYERQRAALARDGAAGYVALYCRSCKQVYCYKHWSVEYLGEGSPRSFGTCPKGHGRVIDGG